jgi:hypothetical protein
MSIIKLSNQFLPFAGNNKVVEVQGDTIKQSLDNLISRYPVFKELLFDAEGTLSALVLVDGITIVPKNINQSVSPQQEIIVLPMVQGG